jgi:prepilin-type N-terminal cleavage/methylation domain-containing protein
MGRAPDDRGVAERQREAGAVRRAGRRPRGYTLVELMMALALFAIAVLGIISMQKITVTSNGHAKNLAIAQRIAQSWATQLELDATTWNANLANVSWLGGQNGVTLGIWSRPQFVVARGFGAAFDALGNPLTDDALAQAQFCSNVRLTQLYADTPNVVGNGMMRAEIRVYWLRDGEQDVAPPFCKARPSADEITKIEQSPGVYHFIYQAAGVRQHSAI